MDEVAAKRILYTLKMNESTMRAVRLIKRGEIEALGEIINEQHELMRDLYDLSLPELKKIRNSMLEAGALGVKISGAGLGGCLIAITLEKEHAERILDRALNSGAAKGWVLEIDEGARIENI